MARKAGQWEEEEVAQSHEEEERCQPAKRRRCRVTGTSPQLGKAPISDSFQAPGSPKTLAGRSLRSCECQSLNKGSDWLMARKAGQGEEEEVAQSQARREKTPACHEEKM
ncbi:hypothetical protein STEG23_014751 [Scotinomys teguina]